MAGAYEFTDEDVVRIQDKNVIDGAVKTTGKVEISGTTFDGNCYIIADGDITYNVNDLSPRVVLCFIPETEILQLTAQISI